MPFVKDFALRYKASPLARRMAQGAFWSLAGAMLSRGLSLVSSILVARMLGKHGFGQLGMIQSTVGMFQIFAGFSLGLTATKYVAELREKDREKVGRIISLSLIFATGSGALVTIILLGTAHWVAEHTLAAPAMGALLMIGSPLLIFGAIAGAQTGALSGFEAFKSIAIVNVLTGLINFPCLVGGVYFGGVNGAVWGLVAASAIGVVLNQLVLSREALRAGIAFPARNALSEKYVLWHFSLPAVLASMLVTPVNWASAAILVNQHEGYAEMGIFNAANQWRGAILFLPGILCQVGLPLLCSLNGDSEGGKKSKKVMRYNLLLNGGVTFVVALVVSVLSVFIMGSYGATFSSGYSVLVLLAISTVLVSINNVIGQSVTSAGKMWLGLGFNAIWASTLMVFSYLFIPTYGALGLAGAYLAAYLVHTVVQGMYAMKIQG